MEAHRMELFKRKNGLGHVGRDMGIERVIDLMRGHDVRVALVQPTVRGPYVDWIAASPAIAGSYGEYLSFLEGFESAQVELLVWETMERDDGEGRLAGIGVDRLRSFQPFGRGGFFSNVARRVAPMSLRWARSGSAGC